MRRNVEKKLKSLRTNSKKIKKILDDITEYFENEWLTVLDSWYEGYNGAFTPSTNNQLEATNKVIKDERTFRERHTLSRFLTVASDIVNK
jgi:hypothetical protein